MKKLLCLLLALLAVFALSACSDATDGIEPDYTEEEGFPTEADAPYSTYPGRRIPYKRLRLEDEINTRHEVMIFRNQNDLDLALAEYYISPKAHRELSKKNYDLYQVLVFSYHTNTDLAQRGQGELKELVVDHRGVLFAVHTKAEDVDDRIIMIDDPTVIRSVVLVKKSDLDLSACENIFDPEDIYLPDA